MPSAEDILGLILAVAGWALPIRSRRSAAWPATRNSPSRATHGSRAVHASGDGGARLSDRRR